jgi:TonB family protein
MKTQTALLAAQLEPTRWYAEKPFAYRNRETYTTRMGLGLGVAVGVYLAVLAAFFLLRSTESEEITVKTKAVYVDVTSVPPPPPPSTITEKNSPTSVSAKAVYDGMNQSVATALANGDMTNAEARATVSAIAAAAVEEAFSSLNQSMSEAFGDGVPTPTSGATNGLLASLGSSGSLGLNADGAASPFGLTTNGQLGFTNEVSQGLTASARSQGLVGNREASTTITAKRTFGVRKQKLDIKDAGRTEEDIAATLRSYQEKIYNLFASAQKHSASAQGLAEIQLVIAPSGTVTDVQITKTSISDFSFQRGLKEAFRHVQFSKIEQPINQRVKVPYEFYN